MGYGKWERHSGPLLPPHSFPNSHFFQWCTYEVRKARWDWRTRNGFQILKVLSPLLPPGDPRDVCPTREEAWMLTFSNLIPKEHGPWDWSMRPEGWERKAKPEVESACRTRAFSSLSILLKDPPIYKPIFTQEIRRLTWDTSQLKMKASSRLLVVPQTRSQISDQFSVLCTG